jgi:hypothetical protein
VSAAGRYLGCMPAVYEWRGAFTNQEINALHAEAFNTRVFDESEWNWAELGACGFAPTNAGLLSLD